jgi:hypothetical protein
LCYTTGCFRKQDQTTTIYGAVTDQNKRPVDSILVMLDGVKNSRYDELKETYTDKNGNYEIVLDVPKSYTSVNLSIPFFPVENSKFVKNYSGFSNLSKNDEKTNNCCFATIGVKTKYDFELKAK